MRRITTIPSCHTATAVIAVRNIPGLQVSREETSCRDACPSFSSSSSSGLRFHLPEVNPNTNWVALCASSNPKRVVRNNVVVNNPGFGSVTGAQDLHINKPDAPFGSEVSNFEAVEVITWDRALTPTEMQSVMTDIWSVRMGN